MTLPKDPEKAKAYREACRIRNLGKKMSEESKRKVSASLMGNKRNQGKLRTEEQKKIISERMRGENNYFYGKHHTPESIEKNRMAHIGKPSSRKGVTLTDETKEKIRAARIGNFGNHREPVAREGLIRLSNGEIAVVDIEDYPLLNKHLWSGTKRGNVDYAHRTNHGKQITMHHAIMGVPKKGLMIDHINGNGLDNRKCNLRVVTNRENCQNRHWRKGSPIVIQCTSQETN